MYLTNVEETYEKVSVFMLNNQMIFSLVVIVAAIVLSIFLQRFVYNIVIFFSTDKNKSKTNKMLRSSCNIIGSVLKYFVYIITFFIILAIYQVQIGVMITSAGFIGILVTYIFQDLIKDITNGFHIVYSAPFEIGDRVKIDGFVGKVKEIKSRYVVLSDVNGNKCIINNRKIDSVVVLNKKIDFRKGDRYGL